MAGNKAGRILLNVGCGAVRPAGWVNCDCSLNSVAQSLLVLRYFARKFIKSTIYEQHNVVYMNLNRPWRFSEGTVDVVYASHVFEHLSTGSAQHFLAESRRTLRVGGALRIVVPDLLALAEMYVERARNGAASASHEFLGALDMHFGNICPPEKPLITKIAYWLQGCPHQHKYMYDAASMLALLHKAGFLGVVLSKYGESEYIPEICDVENGQERYSPSIYVEARKAISQLNDRA